MPCRIPPKFREVFDGLMQNELEAEFKECQAFMRHKRYLVDPVALKTLGVIFNKIVKKEGNLIWASMESLHF